MSGATLSIFPLTNNISQSISFPFGPDVQIVASLIKTAFGFEGYNVEDIDRVYPKDNYGKVSEKDIHSRINTLLKLDISKEKILIDDEEITMNESNITEGVTENDGEEGTRRKKQKKFVIYLLN